MLNLEFKRKDKTKSTREYRFRGLFDDGVDVPNFPTWLYKEGADPRKVNNRAELEQAKLEGWDALTATEMSNKYLINWIWDLEDMSPKQLRLYAYEEYDVDLPEDASQDTLFKAVLKLIRSAPQNRSRIVLMAHTIKMEYDATIEQIRKMVDTPSDYHVLETETREFYA